MSREVPPGHWQPPPHGLGRLCPACGAPLRDAATTCPACGASPEAGTAPRHLMTPFGHGVCAFGGSFMLGIALSMALKGGLPHWALALAPLCLGAWSAWAASAVGRRLLPQWRCSYEHLLTGWLVGGPCALVAVLAGLAHPESLLLVWAGGATGTYLLMRRYGYRAGDLG